MPSVPPLVPGRDCGSCTVCCVALAIKDPDLRKEQGVPCTHLVGGCSIYPSRPGTCRAFYCGWRMLRWVRPGLRPDQSGVLVRLVTWKGEQAVAFVLLEEGGATFDGVAESVAAAVMAGVPTCIEVLKPGYMASTGPLNERLLPAVTARDKLAVSGLLRQAWEGGQAADGAPPPEA